MTAGVHPDDFDVAKAIVAHVKDLSPERRERVFRWVAESLGLPSAPPRVALLTAATQAAVSPSAPTPSTDRGMDIKTFISSKAPKSDAQFATAVAYYYRFEAPNGLRRESIDGSTLQEAARLAGRMRLTDPRNTLNNAKKSGYLDNAARGEFSINNVGENLVAMTLPGGESMPVGGRSKRSTAAKKKKS